MNCSQVRETLSEFVDSLGMNVRDNVLGIGSGSYGTGACIVQASHDDVRSLLVVVTGDTSVRQTHERIDSTLEAGKA